MGLGVFGIPNKRNEIETSNWGKEAYLFSNLAQDHKNFTKTMERFPSTVPGSVQFCFGKMVE